MYSIVIMMALGNGGTVPAYQDQFTGRGSAPGHLFYRHNRGCWTYRGGLCPGHCYNACSGHCYNACPGHCYRGCGGYNLCPGHCYSAYPGHCYSGGSAYGSWSVYAGAGQVPARPTSSTLPLADSTRLQMAAGRPAPADLIVHLPADAKLIIDGNATQSASGTRRFTSPPLEREQDFFYTLKGQLVRDGQTLTASRRVKVRAGEQTEVTLEFSAGILSAKSSE